MFGLYIGQRSYSEQRRLRRDVRREYDLWVCSINFRNVRKGRRGGTTLLGRPLLQPLARGQLNCLRASREFSSSWITMLITGAGNRFVAVSCCCAASRSPEPHSWGEVRSSSHAAAGESVVKVKWETRQRWLNVRIPFVLAVEMQRPKT